MTELLPISSSGHLILVPWLGDWTYLEQHDEFNQTFDVALHLGTLVAVVVYFRREIGELLVAFFGSLARRRIRTAGRARGVDRRSSRPFPRRSSAPRGRASSPTTSASRGRSRSCSPSSPACSGSRTGSRPTRTASDLGLWSALGIGCAQALSLMPGVSRSGITISAARFLGLTATRPRGSRSCCWRRSRLGAVPAEGRDRRPARRPAAGWEGPFLVGTLAAAGAGLLAIGGLLGYVRRHDYTLFVVYRLVVAALVLLLIATGAREATF